MSDYWNPILETLPPDALRDLQVRRFREQLAYTAEHSPFYRQKLDDAGIDVDAIDSFADIRAVPTTTKAELRDAQTTDPFPYGDLLAVDTDAVTEYHQTSGTTGHPVRQADSWRDWEWWGDCWATVLWAQGIRPDDRVFFPFSYNVFVAFWAAHYACERIGAEVVPGGNLSSAQRVRKMVELEVTAFMSTPTYALRLAEVARDEGYDPEDFALDTVVCAGEPGASIPGTAERIESAWDADVHDHAGATETGAWGFSCDGGCTGLHFNEAQFLVEVLDDAGEPVDPGERGELVITPLNRRAQPYIRFELSDQVRVTAHSACDCGRTFRVADGGVLGRSDDLTKVNGVLFAPTAVEDTVRAFDGVADEFAVCIDSHPEKADIDVVTVVVELAPDADRTAKTVGRALRKELKQTLNLTPRVVVEPYETLDRPELKADRVTDNRTNHV